MTLLHPAFKAIRSRAAEGRARLQARLAPAFPKRFGSLGATFLAAVPLVYGEALSARLRLRVGEVVRLLRRETAMGVDPAGWAWAGPPDVLTIDVAVVASDRPEGWDLRVVEFQAFPSVAATGFLMDAACRAEHPELDGFRPWGGDPDPEAWRRRAKAVLAPSEASAVVDVHPETQFTAWDFDALNQLFGQETFEATRLRVTGPSACLETEAGSRPLTHLANRVVPTELREHPDGARLRATLDALPTPCFGHPAWYDRVHKGWLAKLDLPDADRCFSADRWRDLPRPVEDYVLKDTRSWGGKDVILRPTPEQVEALEAPEAWILQPRFEQVPLFEDPEGKPIYAELRVMVALDEAMNGWPMMSLARMNRVPVASARAMDGSGCTGLQVGYLGDGSAWESI